MTKIQYITERKPGFKEDKDINIKISTFYEYTDINEFDINIIDLCFIPVEIHNTGNFNEYIYHIYMYFDELLTTLFNKVNKSSTKKYLLLLPQLDETDADSDNIISIMNDYIQKFLNTSLNIDIKEENTNTNFLDNNINSSFYFDIKNKDININIVSKSTAGCPTTISYNNKAITTLKIINTNYMDNNEILSKLLNKLNFISKVPKWFDEIKYFNDTILDADIKDFKDKINTAQKKLEINNKYKSITYTNGDELVYIIIKILGQALNEKEQANNFKDLKQEDLLIKKNDITFIFEIKGVDKHINKSNISQLYEHVSLHKSRIEKEKLHENLKGILIINPQRNKELKAREKIHPNVTDKAERDNILIITTEILLNLYESFINKKISTDDIVELFKNKTGLLDYPRQK